MKQLLLTLLMLVMCGLRAQTLSDMVLRDDVKTVQLYTGGAEREFPVLTLDGDGRMVLEFDVLRAQPEALHWHFVHCDRHWAADGLDPVEFINGFVEGTIDDYDFSFTTLVDYVHYRAVLPEGFASFTHSGNYVVEVTDDHGQPLLRRRFCVNEQTVKVEADITRPYDNVDIDRRQEVDVKLTAQRPEFGDPQYLEVIVQQNGRLDNRRSLSFSGYDGSALAWRHRQENIFHGGNNFRFFDCSNLRTPMYNVMRVEEYGGETFAILRPDEDRSRRHYLSETTLNGGMKVNIWDRNNPRLEADYVWVNFSLPMSQPLLDGSVYVVGALTDWRLDSVSRMDYNPQYRAYTKRLLLKQGYYAYLLLVDGAAWPANRSRTAPLEGDHRETPNSYTVFVYYRSPADRADRLIAVWR